MGTRVVITTVCVLVFLRCALMDPGILGAANSRPNVDLHEASEEGTVGESASTRPLRRNRRVLCSVCGVHQPLGCSHCDFCQVCVDGYDHHCVWMGKCIGKRNLCAFYSFVGIGITSSL